MLIFSFSRYFNFSSDFIVNVGKRLEKKANVGFKINEVTHWITNEHNIV